MSELASVEIERLDGIVVARVSGEIDASNAAVVQAQLLDGLANEGAGLVVDLTEAGYVDSAGIRILFDTGARLGVRGMGLRLVAAPESFTADVLETVRIADRFPVHDTAASAVSALSQRLPRP